MRYLSRSFVIVIVAIVLGGIAVGACLAALIPGTVELATAHHYTAEQVGELKALAQPSTVYYSDGVTEMGTFGLEARDPIKSLDEVPKLVQNAVIATEDRSFWENDGIDLGATFRAFLTNLTSGEIEQGGSTITQQLVKNRILTSKRDVNRKITEIEDSLRLSEKFTKEKILVEYLNTVYFGSGSYGIKSAASRFFLTTDDPSLPFPRGKRLDELNIAEAALLAGMIQSPDGNSPFLNPDRAIRRRADVLRGMVSEGYITQAEADQANATPLPKVEPPANPIVGHNFLQTEVLQDLLNDPRLGATEKERSDRILKGGLKIYTTIDKHLQDLAVDATTNDKPQFGPDWASSLVSIDPATGAVKAMVSGQDYAQSQTNIATSPDGRQTGSIFKVITLATALSNGYSPNDQVDGTSPCSVPGFEGSTVNAEGGGGSMTTIRDATAGSINCAFVRIATSVGEQKVIDTAHIMGILKQNLEPYLTLTLGVFEQNPETMASVMATVANNGMYHRPHVVQKVMGPDGAVVFDETGAGLQVLEPAVTACEQNLLRAVVTGGTGTKANVPGHNVFGKTGTTDSQTDAWFLGATPQLATAVWFGNWRFAESGAGYGGDSAAPIFRSFMTRALANQPAIPLPDPGPVCARAGEMVIPEGGRAAAPPVVAPVVPEAPVAQPAAPAPTDPAAPAPTAPAAPAAGAANGTPGAGGTSDGR